MSHTNRLDAIAFQPQVIPEPTTVTLLVIGLAGVGVAAWKRKK